MVLMRLFAGDRTNADNSEDPGTEPARVPKSSINPKYKSNSFDQRDPVDEKTVSSQTN